MSRVIIPQDSTESKRLSRQTKEGKVRRIHKGVYTDNLEDALEKIVMDNWMHIVISVAPGAILSYRTAIELRPVSGNSSIEKLVFVTGKHASTIRLPGLSIKVSKGNFRAYIEPVLPNLFRSSEPRAILENLTRTRKTQGIAKTLCIKEVEEYLATLLINRGEDALNALRDIARDVASQLEMQQAFSRLNAIISSLLTSHNASEKVLQTEHAKAVARQEPFDSERVGLFESLAVYLRRCVLIERPFVYQKKSWEHLSFFESYFSNYIEGTEFLIDEAEDIVYSGKTFGNRYADSHDVLSLYHLLSDLSEMTKTPQTHEELMKLLKQRHAFILRKRPNKQPGKLKQVNNRAGNTIFVNPNEVIGTLSRAFSIYETLSHPCAKAVFMMFVVSEVHPFDDGNGRIARVMMNAELSASNQMKIIIPTVHRDNYLGGLRRASRDQIFQTYCKVIDQAQAYTASINWTDYGEAREKLERDSANMTADEGLPIFNRALRKLKLSSLPVD